MFYKTGLLSRGLTIERGITFQYLRYSYHTESMTKNQIKASENHQAVQWFFLVLTQPLHCVSCIPIWFDKFLCGRKNCRILFWWWWKKDRLTQFWSKWKGEMLEQGWWLENLMMCFSSSLLCLSSREKMTFKIGIKTENYSL